MRVLLRQDFRVRGVTVRLGLGALAGVVVAAVAAAQEPLASKAGAGADQFWVQERPLSALVSNDLVGQDRRFAGALGYGINLVPPSPDRDAAQIALNNWHFGLD